MRTFELTEDDLYGILDQLVNAANGLSEYGGSDGDFEELRALERKINMMLYGAADTPTVRMPRESAAPGFGDIGSWIDRLKRNDTPFLATLGSRVNPLLARSGTVDLSDAPPMNNGDELVFYWTYGQKD